MSQLAKQLIAEAKRTNAKTLDLGNCGLTELPDELFELTALEELNLCNENWDYKHEKWVESKNQGSLNQLKALKKGIAKLKALKILQINGDWIKKTQISNISFLKNLTGLQTLDLCGIQISDISFLEKLTSLERLDLRSNQISDISFLENLTELQRLDLRNNKISDISFLENLTGLQTLVLSNNKISDISFLENLTGLQTLLLSDNKISDFSFLENLTGLQTLVLRYNQISDISFLKNLTGLQTLVLSANKISDISFLKNLTGLQTLDLRYNQISDISFLKNLTGLQTLALSYNQISDISFLEKLTGLQKLDLCSNKISDISFLKNLTGLQTLGLHNNSIEGLDTLDQYKNYTEEVKEFFTRLQEKGNINIKLPVKILMLGNHSVGKSVLCNYFIKGAISSTTSTHILEIKPYSKITKGKLPQAIFFDFGGQDYYHGLYRIFLSKEAINVLLWNYETNHNELAKDSKGQITHHFNIHYWLSHKDFREKNFSTAEDNDILFLIKTGIDKHNDGTYLHTECKVDHQLQLCLAQQDDLKEVSATLVDSYETGQKHFAALLKASIEQQQHVLESQPKWYEDFLEGIYNNTLIETEDSLKPVELSRIINETDYNTRKTNAEKGTAEAKQEIYGYLQTQLDQLHRSGVVLFYKEIESLKDVVWLNPAGLIEAIHTKIFKQDLFEDSETPGIVQSTEIENQLCLDVEADAQLIELLKLQKVLFHHKIQVEKGADIDEYIIPNFLPLVNKNDPNYFITVFGLSQPAFVLSFQHFMPLGLINQLVCFFGQQPDRKLFWRDQILFTLNKEARVLININLEALSISVSIQLLENAKMKKQDLDKYLFKVLLAMYWDYEPLTLEEDQSFRQVKKIGDGKISLVDRFIGSMTNGLDTAKSLNWLSLNNDDKDVNHRKPKDLYISIDSMQFVKYRDIATTKGNHVTSYPLLKKNENGKIFNFEEPKLIHKTQFNAFMENPVAAPKKVFISYSKNDIQYKNELLVHLKKHQRLGHISIWEDGQIDFGEWDAQIKKELAEADIVVCLISQNFFNSEYIWENELKKSLERAKKKECTIIPVLLRDCDWQDWAGFYHKDKLTAATDKDLAISDIQFLPYYDYENEEGVAINRKLRPIAEWPKGKEPLMQVVRTIKKLSGSGGNIFTNH